MGYRVKEDEHGQIRAGFPESPPKVLENFVQQCIENKISYHIVNGLDILDETIFDDDALEQLLQDFDLSVVEKYDPESQAKKKMQRTAMLMGVGINKIDALNSIEKQLYDLISSGSKINGFSFVDLGNNQLGGICIYEQGQTSKRNKKKVVAKEPEEKKEETETPENTEQSDIV